MRHVLRRALPVLALLAAPALPAHADTTAFTLTGTWQIIASAGQNVDVQNNNGTGYAVLSTSTSGPPSGSTGQALGPGEHRLYSLSADLYALGTAPVVVTSGFGGAASPLPAGSNTIGAVLQAGSTGSDASVNAAAVPMAGFVLLATIAATPTRAFVEVQNQSAGTVQVVRDDGAGNNQTSILLAPGAGAGAQGGGWSSASFRGRVRIYAASAGAQVAAYQD